MLKRLLLAAALATPLFAGDAPLLRIENGGHSAPITCVASDAAGKVIVTGSDDKTIRVWDAKSGEQLTVIRPPIGEAGEGTVEAVAISPDGSTIAAGGIFKDAAGAYRIYLIDRSGKIRSILGPLNLPARRLEFSPEGTLLAAELSSPNEYYEHPQAVAVFQLPSGHQLPLPVEASGCAPIALGAHGRIALQCGGTLNLLSYDAGDGTISLSKSVDDELFPNTLAFSPSANRLLLGEFLQREKVNAVGRVLVRAVPDLAIMWRPKMDGNVSRGLWQDDATIEVVASSKKLGFVIKRISQRSFAEEKIDLDNSRSVVAHVPGQGAAYISTQGEILIASGAPTQRVFLRPNVFRQEGSGIYNDVALSDDGRKLWLRTGADQPVYVDLGQRRVDVETDVERPDPSKTGVSGFLSDYRMDLTVKFYDDRPGLAFKNNGGELIEETGIADLLALPDLSRLVIYGRRDLVIADKEGHLIRKYERQSADFVGFSPDGKTFAAHLRDGSVRWYRTSDGAEFLALFLAADGKRWVSWTPSGYYDASPGGEELIGWQVNNGRDATADFYPASKFRDNYYRPDIVARALETMDEPTAVRLATEASGGKPAAAVDVTRLLPPVVEIVSPADGAAFAADAITVRFNIRTPSGDPVTNVRALVDGRPAGTPGRGLIVGAQSQQGIGATREITVPMPPHDAEVSIIAANANATSVPATVHLRWKRKTSDDFIAKPKLYVLAVGISQYAAVDLKLAFAAKDAHDFAAAMERQKEGLYRDVVIKILTDGAATRDEIADGLDWIIHETTSRDVAAVFFAGHGVNDANGQYFFLPYNADPDRLRRTAIPFSDIQSAVQALAGKTLFFVDSCHSGNVLGSRRGTEDINGIINELTSAENGAIVFAASTGRQYSLEDASWENGAFTKAVVEGLSGKADYNHSGKISVNMLELYISERVKALTRGRQTPTMIKPQTVPDFPIALATP